jgi:hypothetical protein
MLYYLIWCVRCVCEVENPHIELRLGVQLGRLMLIY